MPGSLALRIASCHWLGQERHEGAPTIVALLHQHVCIPFVSVLRVLLLLC